MERSGTGRALRRCSEKGVQTVFRTYTQYKRAELLGDAASVPGRWGGRPFWVEIIFWGDLWRDLRRVAHWSQGRDCARADGGPVHGQTNPKGALVVYDTASTGLERNGLL